VILHLLAAVVGQHTWSMATKEAPIPEDTIPRSFLRDAGAGNAIRKSINI